MKKDWKKILILMLPIISSSIDLIKQAWKVLNEEFSEETQKEYAKYREEIKNVKNSDL